jgi:aminoglycoside phosphotransferase (APT) family kinase protein
MPFNSVRGVPLRERLVYFEREVVDLPAPLVAVARRYVATAVDEPVDRDVVFMHGDVHRANLMQIDGSLTSLIDFGDLGYGDRAGDLGGAIFSVGIDGVADLLAGYGPVSTSTLVKAFGWACYFAVRNFGVGDRTAETALEFLTTLAAHGH